MVSCVLFHWKRGVLAMPCCRMVSVLVGKRLREARHAQRVKELGATVAFVCTCSRNKSSLTCILVDDDRPHSTCVVVVLWRLHNPKVQQVV